MLRAHGNTAKRMNEGRHQYAMTCVAAALSLHTDRQLSEERRKIYRALTD